MLLFVVLLKKRKIESKLVTYPSCTVVRKGIVNCVIIQSAVIYLPWVVCVAHVFCNN